MRQKKTTLFVLQNLAYKFKINYLGFQYCCKKLREIFNNTILEK